jgi:hypothetical protein
VPRRNEAFSVCCGLATGAGCLIGRKTASHRFAHLLSVFSVIGVMASPFCSRPRQFDYGIGANAFATTPLEPGKTFVPCNFYEDRSSTLGWCVPRPARTPHKSVADSPADSPMNGAARNVERRDKIPVRRVHIRTKAQSLRPDLNFSERASASLSGDL